MILNGLEVLSSASDKRKFFAKIFSKICNLDDSGVSLSAPPSTTNLKLHNISVTPKMVTKVTTNFDCIPMVVLKNCEPQFSYILAELFNICLKDSCFPDFWKVPSVALYLRMLGKGPQL